MGRSFFERARSRSGLALLLLVAALSLSASEALAHVRSTTGYSEITQTSEGVGYELSLEYELFAHEVGLGEAARAAVTDEARLAVLRDSGDLVAGYLQRKVRLSLDGVACEQALVATGVGERQSLPYATMRLGFACIGSPSGSYELSYDVFARSIVDEHINVVDYGLGGEVGRAILGGDESELAIGDAGLLSSAWSFVSLGVEHILGGLDHLLFLFALLLGAKSFRSLLKIATTFTIAHSLTLVLATVGWVNIPGTIVEPLIALSIAYVAVSNLIRSESRERLLVVFVFGLLHGLGFASALSFTDGFTGRLLVSLLTFNVGIELGQAMVIGLAYPLLLFVRRYKRLSWPAHAGATSLIALFGLVWFFERLSV